MKYSKVYTTKADRYSNLGRKNESFKNKVMVSDLKESKGATAQRKLENLFKN
jgi:hypothetical protein